MQHLGRPKVGQALLDGSQARTRPLERPTVFQLLGARGEVLETDYLLPGMETPSYEVMDETGRKRIRTGLLVGAGAGLVLAGAMEGAAVALRAGPYAAAVEAWNTRGSTDARDSANNLYATNHALAIGAGTLGALAVAAGTIGFVVSW